MSAKIQGAAGHLLEVSSTGEAYVKTLSDHTLKCMASAEISGTLSATAHTWGTGLFGLLFNPTNATKKFRVERIVIAVGGGAMVAATPWLQTSPRIQATKFTAVGTPSGTAWSQSAAGESYGKFNATDDAITGLLYKATTGLSSIVQGAPLLSAMALAQAGVGTAANQAVIFPVEQFLFLPRGEEYEVTLAAGEGIMIWQPDAGSTADTRRYSCQIQWSENTYP